MNIIDIIIIAALIWGALSGFIRGFFKQTVVFLGTILVVVLAFILKNPLSQIMYKNLPFFKLGGLTSLNIVIYEVIALIVAVSILSIVLAVVIKITGIIERVLKATIVLAIPSKLLGMLVGIIESIVVCYVVLFILSLPVLKVPYINESKGANLILTKTPIVSNITGDVINTFREITDETKNSVDLKDIKGTNTKMIEILLKNKVVTTDNIKILVEKKKIDINDVEVLIEKYKEA